MNICGHEIFPDNLPQPFWSLVGVIVGFLLSSSLQIYFRFSDKKKALNESANSIVITTKKIIDDILAAKDFYFSQINEAGGIDGLDIETVSKIQPSTGTENELIKYDEGKLHALFSRGENKGLNSIIELQRHHKAIVSLMQQHEKKHFELQDILMKCGKVEWNGNIASYYPNEGEISIIRPRSLILLDLVKLIYERLESSYKFSNEIISILGKDLYRSTGKKSYKSGILIVDRI